MTQIFDRRDKYITNDSVFAVKDSLIVDFEPFEGDAKAEFKLDYDFRLASYEAVEKAKGPEKLSEMTEVLPAT